ncbi:hypothetical protein FPCIR_5484 [Fusarium pseudocircinatum]|uniref:Uncharacterized protein n=1 Tax=Fusarium pseudocircinatum TaxID=56676 RepID=A0A8H5ULH5_9HYPO|nr:hypothetical protein FPCIR_5484 [Fusarium pseudocircinatum]
MAPDAAASASAPSSSPATPRCGLLKPKRLPKRKHYYSELAYLEDLRESIQAKRLRLAYNAADLNWIHAERARLAERLKVVDSLRKADAESIDALEDEIAVLRKRAEAPAEALAPGLEKYFAEARKIVDEEKAAASASKTEGPEPNSSNPTTITLSSLTHE